MATVVVPFRSTDPKRRLSAVAETDRIRLAHAMLADVLAAAGPLGEALVVAAEPPELPAGARHVPDPRRGQGAAVRAALDAAVAAGLAAPYVVVNADLPCATTRDLLALVGALPEHGLALAAAADGTTNALALSDEGLFEPVYGPGSAERFAALAPSTRLDAPNLMDDVDTPDDLARLAERVGEHTRRVLASLHLESAA
ncbi:MAG: 2-phospho-L-lactate/phosphoenolpyruvate guanylyltransferase [Gaiellaceae bacterium]|jgi:2-phospho-L-lactate guanylyltransferase|nr:2-phospho-L-lactate/phosphoenolpyruvate guanylyltransferase [Gaiellaceae bacterium]